MLLANRCIPLELTPTLEQPSIEKYDFWGQMVQLLNLPTEANGPF